MKKSILKRMISILAFGTFLASLSAFADSERDLTGAYKGELQNGETVDLLMRPIPGRAGSYLGVMVQLDPRVVIYRIDPLGPSSYAMNPLEVTADGEVGVTNDDPSLVLNLASTRDRDNRLEMTITNANSSNNRGFRGPIRFEGNTRSRLSWDDYYAGEYALQGGNNRLSLSPMVDFEASIASLADGGMVIREKGNGVFTLKRVTVSSTGAQVDSHPKRIGIFITQSGFFSDSHLFLLVSPEQERDVDTYELR